MRWLKIIIVLSLLGVAGWLWYDNTWRQKSHIAEDWRDYIDALHKAWHSPESAEALDEFIKVAQATPYPHVREYTTIAAAIGCRLQDDKSKYRRLTAYLLTCDNGRLAKKLLDDANLSEPCKMCNGSGQAFVECSFCNGSGKCPNKACKAGYISYRALDGGHVRKVCPVCKGTSACPKCSGQGRVLTACPKCNGRGHCYVVTANSLKKNYKEALSSLINQVGAVYNAFEPGYTYADGRWEQLDSEVQQASTSKSETATDADVNQETAPSNDDEKEKEDAESVEQEGADEFASDAAERDDNGDHDSK